MPTGQERLVLAACDELAENGHGFVLDSDIARATGMGLSLVRDSLCGLGREGFLDLARLADGGLTASVTPRGRQELVTDRRDDGPPARVPDQRSLVRIVPRGVQALDQHDADVYLQLLPDYEGEAKLPKSVAFWKDRIEGTDPDRTFRIGVIYGLSGCGKSSLVKAGLFPKLRSHVLKVFTTANDQDTEERLLAAVRLRCPLLPQDKGLGESLAALRRGEGLAQGEKILIVLDQFEQWLVTWQREAVSVLADALRSCDGYRVQAMLLVRDDHLSGAIDLLKGLGGDFKFDTDRNARRVESFTREHARDVLIAYGRGCKKIQNDPSPEQGQFLEAALDGLQSDRSYLPVRLALFAQVFKGRDWTVAELNRVGRAEGVGVAFLEENFGAQDADPRCRRHLRAVQPVLKALMPESLSGIKGPVRSYSELLVASDYGARPSEFADLIGILDGELHLLTPVVTEGDDVDAPTQKENHYQLTHDYLVPSIRDWLARKQKETRRGMAELLLAERSALWNAKSENRHLPSLSEWLSIRLRTNGWTEPQRRMMERAGVIHGVRSLCFTAALAALIFLGMDVRRRVIESNQATVASGLVYQLLKAKLAQVPGIVERMGTYRRWVDPALTTLTEEASDDSSVKLHASLALLPTKDGNRQVGYLYQRLLVSRPDEVLVLREALKDRSTSIVPKLWSVLDLANSDDSQLLPAASALALYDPANPSWQEVSSKVSQAMVAVRPVVVPAWLEALRPVRHSLTPPLWAILEQCPDTERSLVTSIVLDYMEGRPEELANLLMEADPKAFLSLFPIAKESERDIVKVLRTEIGKKPGEKSDEGTRDHLARRQARAVATMFRLGKADEIRPLLKHVNRAFDRIFIIMLENELESAVLKDEYMRGLQGRGVRLSNYHGVTRPCQPNYVAAVAGLPFVTSNVCQEVEAASIVDLLEAKGITWKAYMENLPEDNKTVCISPDRLYFRKHNPFVSLNGVRNDPARLARVVNADRLRADIDGGALPQFCWYTPNIQNDGHSPPEAAPLRHWSGVTFLSRWLKGFLDPLLADPRFTKGTLVVVTFDQSLPYKDNHVYTVLLGDMVGTASVEADRYDHYSLLRTIEENFGLGTLGLNDLTANWFRFLWGLKPPTVDTSDHAQ
jgi:hypothetical protein